MTCVFSKVTVLLLAPRASFCIAPKASAEYKVKSMTWMDGWKFLPHKGTETAIVPVLVCTCLGSSIRRRVPEFQTLVAAAAAVGEGTGACFLHPWWEAVA